MEGRAAISTRSDGVHTGSLIIQIHKSGRNSGNSALQLGSLLNITDCIQHNLLIGT